MAFAGDGAMPALLTINSRGLNSLNGPGSCIITPTIALNCHGRLNTHRRHLSVFLILAFVATSQVPPHQQLLDYELLTLFER